MRNKTLPSLLVTTGLLLGACTADDTTAADTAIVEPATQPAPRFIEQGIVYQEGTDIGGGGNWLVDFTLTETEVDLALTTIGAAPELSWAQDHTMFFYGRFYDDDARIVRVLFDCQVELDPEDPVAAIYELQSQESLAGGGDCHGQAEIDATTGEVLVVGVNGES